MSNNIRKEHWETIYQTKQLKDVSWYQPVPETSLDFLRQFDLPKTAKIIDVGGGDSLFVDYLLELGYTDVSVLDISEKALERAKERLGEKARLVKWIVSDVSTFEPQEHYDFWHDRAVFHFLTEEQDIENYMNVLAKGIKTDGILVMGTFSETGPTKCSGIPIKQYSEKSMTEQLGGIFDKIRCLTVDHTTPFDTIQHFVFCGFRRKVILQLN
jgi:2-polyprenyl-3-methyl-5-hydroxy-6-metoxy-1,4-benzoquinol methylase